ncbi:MAG: hypothetical protein K8J09_17165 [Planctomycetes bacterium]|nr:hypothetical protein [Planctomycetota bacterium]MCC7395506.1 hypothetical protein [Planctomycetota bacterium]
MNSQLRRLTGALAAACTLLAAASSQSIVSTFDTGNDGWLVVGTSYSSHITNPGSSGQAAVWDAVNGQPPGSLRVGDVYGETGVAAPAAFLGDRLPWFGGSISWDIYLRYSDAVAYPAVWLIGANRTLSFNLQSPSLNSWQTISVPLLENGWRVNSWQGPAATRSDLMEVLRDLRGIYLNTEWRTGPDDTNLDNVALVPPATGVGTYGTPCFGSNGQWPNLFATGSIVSAGSTTVQLRSGRPLGIVALVLGTAPLAVPLFGCEASILPSPVSLALLLDGSGAVDLPLNLPTAAPGPLAWMQAVSLDPAAPSGAGLVLSNGLSLTVQ